MNKQTAVEWLVEQMINQMGIRIENTTVGKLHPFQNVAEKPTVVGQCSMTIISHCSLTTIHKGVNGFVIFWLTAKLTNRTLSVNDWL